MNSYHYWRFKRYRELLRGKIKKNDKVLSVGCGEGELLSCLPEVEKFGLDIEKKFLKLAKKRNPGACFYLVSADGRFSFKDNFFDWVFCLEVIEHLQKPKKCLAEIRRVLKEGGYLLASTYNHYNFFNLVTRRAFLKKTTWPKHLREYNWRSFPRELRPYFRLGKRTQAGSSRFLDFFWRLSRLPIGEFMIILAQKEE